MVESSQMDTVMSTYTKLMFCIFFWGVTLQHQLVQFGYTGPFYPSALIDHMRQISAGELGNINSGYFSDIKLYIITGKHRLLRMKTFKSLKAR